MTCLELLTVRCLRCHAHGPHNSGRLSWVETQREMWWQAPVQCVACGFLWSEVVHVKY